MSKLFFCFIILIYNATHVKYKNYNYIYKIWYNSWISYYLNDLSNTKLKQNMTLIDILLSIKLTLNVFFEVISLKIYRLY